MSGGISQSRPSSPQASGWCRVFGFLASPVGSLHAPHPNMLIRKDLLRCLKNIFQRSVDSGRWTRGVRDEGPEVLMAQSPPPPDRRVDLGHVTLVPISLAQVFEDGLSGRRSCVRARIRLDEKNFSELCKVLGLTGRCVAIDAELTLQVYEPKAGAP